MTESEKMTERLDNELGWGIGPAMLCQEAAALIRRLQAENEALRVKQARLVEALTPSGDTKAAYHGEFSFSETSQFWDDVTEEWETHTKNTLVPWTTIKEIMAGIRARAAIEEVNHE
jgi:hypothetical protein